MKLDAHPLQHSFSQPSTLFLINAPRKFCVWTWLQVSRNNISTNKSLRIHFSIIIDFFN
jgi:hypothetical protein